MQSVAIMLTAGPQDLMKLVYQFRRSDEACFFFVILLFYRLLSFLWLFWRWLQVFGKVKMPFLLLNIRTIIFEQKVYEIIFIWRTLI
jgi:hypothetical protein